MTETPDNDKSVHRNAGYPDEMQCQKCGETVETQTLRIIRVRLIIPPYGEQQVWCTPCRA